MIFYGGPGESHHKYFVKDPGQLTQRRISDFANQIADRVYEGMAYEIAQEQVRTENALWHVVGCESNVINTEDEFTFFGEFDLFIEWSTEDGSTGTHKSKWKNKDKQKQRRPEHQLHPSLLKIVSREMRKLEIEVGIVKGFTQMKTTCKDGTQ